MVHQISRLQFRRKFCRCEMIQKLSSNKAFQQLGQNWQVRFIFIYLQANEQDIKISIKQTQSQYSMLHGRRRVMTPLTRDQKIKIQIHIYTITLETLRTRRKAVHTLKLVPSAGSKVCPTYNPVFNCRVSIMAWSLGSFIDNIVMGAGTSICERGGISVGSWTSIRLHLMCPLRVKVTAGCPLMPKLSVAKSQTHWLAFSQLTGIRDQLILHNRSQAYTQLMADNGQISWALDYTQRTSIKNLCYWKGWTIKRTNPRV